MNLINNKNQFIICKVDGKNIQASIGESLLQVCFKAYIDIPRFCYHEGLQIAGNCRMCLVEVENSRKLVASCATPVVGGLSVFTKTFRIKKARQAVLEFLLINHPLDCPICDQGGECDLQDITLVFGSDRGRFYEMSKRAVMDKNLGPLIKTIMNRCIHCTRCVRFFKEVSLDFDKSSSALGVLGRGSRMEIGTYVATNLLHELSGNVIDLCPVGALTSKPFAFKARSWELTSQYNFDIVDAFMPRVKMDLSGADVLRVLPYMNEYGHGWISNKTRFFFDSLNQEKSTSCLWYYDSLLQDFSIKLKSFLKNYLHLNFYIKISWKDAFRVFLNYLQKGLTSKIETRYPSILSLNQAWELKTFLLSTGINYNKTNQLFTSSIDFRNFYTIDLSLDFLDNNIWALILLGINLRMESPLLFLHLKRLASQNRIFLMSALNVNTLHKDVNNISLTFNDFFSFLEGRSVYNRVFLKKLVFHKFLFLLNLELSQSTMFKPLLVAFTEIFSRYQTNLFKNSHLMTQHFRQSFVQKGLFSFSVLQRYVGNLSLAEIGLYSSRDSWFSQKLESNKSKLCLYIDNVDLTTNQATNVLFTQTIYINEILKNPLLSSNYSLILPFKSLYVEDNEQFFDIFVQQKSLVSVKPSILNEKSFSDIFKTLSAFMTKTSNIFLYTSLHTMSWTDGLGLQESLSNLYKGLSFFKEVNYEISSAINGFFTTIVCVYKLNLLSHLGVKPMLNFYNDSRMNLVSFSNTLKRSSLVFKKSNKFESFGFLKF